MRAITWRITLARGRSSHTSRSARSARRARTESYCHSVTQLYFETNAARMQYKAFRAAGHFVGSGSVEAGCKAVVAQRLKLSGMRWSVRGATGIATLRCQEASGRSEEIWMRPPTQTSVA